MYYINIFLIYSIFGFLYENFICVILNNNPESGIMYGPWTPIYGLGILFIIFIYNNIKLKKEYQRGIMLFIISFILLTIIEFLGGIIIKQLFNTELWNYSKLPLHIGKYISIEVSLIWSIGSIIYIFFLKKLSDRLILIIPKLITYLLLVIFITDFIITIINKQKIITF